MTPDPWDDSFYTEKRGIATVTCIQLALNQQETVSSIVGAYTEFCTTDDPSPIFRWTDVYRDLELVVSAM
jgi:hypothetical protein